MKAIVMSYSLTGNNKALAGSIARELGVEHLSIEEPKGRTNGAIAADLLLGRTPRVTPAAGAVEGREMVIFVGPVWMGHVATPFRSFFKRLKRDPIPYAYVSISGGALGPNPKLAKELKKRVGTAPAALIDMHIADLLPAGTKPNMKDTGEYQVTDGDIKRLTETMVPALRKVLAN